MFQKILDIIYPIRCPICGDIVVPKNNRACNLCVNKLLYVQEPRCKKCSKPIEQMEKEYCSDCERKSYRFERGFSVWVYDDIMKKSISALKFHSKKEYADFYIHEMVRLYGEIIKELMVDAIVPVPIHISKYLDRGYNQADILARGIGSELDIPVLSKLLIRKRRTLPQKKLNNRERLANLMKAFEFNHKAAEIYSEPINNVLIVDDIYTTGSTITACTNVLIANGVQKVYFITVCIGKGF